MNTAPADRTDDLTPLLIDRRTLAVKLSISTRSLDRLKSNGTLPRSLKLGAKVLWRLSDVEGWIEAGCPRLPH